MSRRARALIAWLPSVACMALLWTLSSIPQGMGPPPYPHLDKLAHLTAYTLLGFLNGAALRRSNAGAAPRILLPALLAAIFGGVDEIHQSFVPGRDTSLGDLLADALGGLLGASLAAKLADLRGQR